MTSRVIGAIMRSVLIIMGSLAQIAVFFAGTTVLLTWLALPLFLVLGFIYGCKILF